jgi:hypothetical protein
MPGLLIGLVVSAGIALRAPVSIDYAKDAGPGIQALLHGGWSGLSAQPLMGPFSLVIRAPLVALVQALGGDELIAYRVGAIPCLFAAALLGLYLWRRLEGRSTDFRLLVAGLCVVNPLTFNAMRTGHPEEVLAGALCVGAVLVAGEGHRWAAMVLLGLAVGTKQWALLAVLPVLYAMPAGTRRAPALAGAGLALALWLPMLAADPAGFWHSNVVSAATTGTGVRPVSLWWALRGPSQTVPQWLGHLSHPLILGLVPLSWLYLRRHGGPRPALFALALIFLLRAVLDPVNNGYYHLPLVLALLAYEATGEERFPYATVGWLALLWMLIVFIWPTPHWSVLNALYLAGVGGLLVYLFTSLRPAAVRSAKPLGGSCSAA